MGKSWIIAIIALGVFVGVDCLQCYHCENCPDSSLQDSQLVTCGAPTTTTTTTTTSTTTTTTTTTTPPPVNPGTNGTDPVINGTDPVINGTDPVINGTDPVINGTDPVVNGTDPVVNGTDPVVNGTDPVVNGTDPVGNGTYSGEHVVSRTRRSVLQASLYAEDTYVCAVATIKGPNDTSLIYRSCEPATIENKTTCEFLEGTFNATNCRACTKDKCNSAYTVQLSMTALLFVLTSIFITK